MLFNSISFLIFLPTVFAVYWGWVWHRISLRNAFLWAVSYLFYGWWDVRFLILIALSSATDFWIGLALAKRSDAKSRKLLVGMSIFINLGALFVFKYFNFFIQSAVIALGSIGVHASPLTLSIVLPVGISFYTFQTLSYTIDVYRKRIEATKDWIAFFAFVSFFPQLVAGPIERAAHLLPQFSRVQPFVMSRAKQGLRQMLWGFFKKVVIADSASVIVDAVFESPSQYSSHYVAVAVFLFSIQIYGDFSGYSDIAIGTARLFGFDLSPNFRTPYFSRNIGEFWRRWHISLSSWFRDYLYVPLGGSKGDRARAVRNITVVFLVSGLWHGANWTFLVWGAFHAAVFVPTFLWNSNRKYTALDSRLVPSMRELTSVVITFCVVSIGWVFFRADNLGNAHDVFTALLRPIGPSKRLVVEFPVSLQLPVIAFMTLMEWINRDREHGLDIARWKTIWRWSLYLLVFLLIVFLGNFHEQSFIYFQF